MKFTALTTSLLLLATLSSPAQEKKIEKLPGIPPSKSELV